MHWVGRQEFEKKVLEYEELEAKSSAQKERLSKLVERNETMRSEVRITTELTR